MLKKDNPIFNILLVDDNPAIHNDYLKVLKPLSESNDNSEYDEMRSMIFDDVSEAQDEKKEEDKKIQAVFDSAFQGEEALKKVIEKKEKGEKYALAFVDVRMPPGWDGIRTIKEIWQVDPDIQIVICSAHSDYTWDKILSILKPEDNLLILKKPFESMELQQIALTLCTKWFNSQELKSTAENLIATNKRLKEVVDIQKVQIIESSKLAQLGALAGGIAHEINNPLAVINGNAERIQVHLKKQELDPDLIMDKTEKIRDTVSRINKIVQGLLHFAQESEGEDYESVKIEDIIKETSIFFDEKFKNKDVRLDFNYETKDAAALCRPVQISQVVLNLITNAYDAISELDEKWIKVDIYEDKDWINIRVTDSGQGIPKDIAENIMQPFFTTKEVGKGTGLGLSISMGIIKDHGGELVLDTDSNNTSFLVRLPHPAKKASIASAS